MEHMQLLIMSLPWVPTMLAHWRMSLYAMVLGVVLKVTYLDHPKVPHKVTVMEREERVRAPPRPKDSPLAHPHGHLTVPSRIYPHASKWVPRGGLRRPSPRTPSTPSRPHTGCPRGRHHGPMRPNPLIPLSRNILTVGHPART